MTQLEEIKFPAMWKVTKLGKHTKRSQYGLSMKGQANGDLPILRMNCQLDGATVFRDLQWVSPDLKTVAAFLLEPGDLLFNRTNSYELVGRMSLFESARRAVFASYLIRITLDKKVWCPRFVNLYFQHPSTQARLKTLASRGVSQCNINANKLKEFPVPKPPLPEQRKIAAVLGKVWEAVEVEEALARNARDLKKSLMRRLFTRGLKDEPVKETEIGTVPESWDVRPIGGFSKLQSGGTPARGIKEYWNEGTIPWVKTGEVNYRMIHETEEKITPTGLANSAARVFPAGTLLIAMYGQGVTRGKVAILGIDAATNQACAAILPDGTLDTGYLYYWLEKSYEELRQRSHGAQQMNLNAQLVSGFEVAHPKELADQREIARILRVVDEKIAVHEGKRDAYRALFKTLLHKLMTAEIRVADLDIETEEVGP